jgi:hypothetical protein
MMHAGSSNSGSQTADIAAAMGLVRMVMRWLLLHHGGFFIGCWVSLSMMVPTAGAWTTTITTTTTRATIWKDLRSKSNINNGDDDGIDGKDDVVVPSPILSLRRRDFVQQSVSAVTAAAATTATGGVGIITTASNWIQPTISQAAEMLPATTTATTVAAAITTATTVASITLPPMGLGAWAWGDSLFWGCKWKFLFLFIVVVVYGWMIGFRWRLDRYFLQTYVSTSAF